MTGGAAGVTLLAEYVLLPDDNVIFGFKTKEWFDAPFKLLPMESEHHKKLRLKDETDFRQTHNPTTGIDSYADLACHTVEPFGSMRFEMTSMRQIRPHSIISSGTTLCTMLINR